MSLREKSPGILLALTFLPLVLHFSCRSSGSGSGLQEESPELAACRATSEKLGMSFFDARDLCEKADPNVNSCVQAAREKLTAETGATKPSDQLSSNQTKQLCATATNHSAACITAARRGALNSFDIRTLCQAGHELAAACISASRDKLVRGAETDPAPTEPLGTIATLELCGTLQPEKNDCILRARKSGLRSGDVYTNCKGSNVDANACLDAARVALSKAPEANIQPSGPMGSMTATTLCGSATPSTAECVTTARTLGVSDSNTFTICKSGDPNATSCLKAALSEIKAPSETPIQAAGPLSHFNVVSICSGPKLDIGPCLETARKWGLSQADIAYTCNAATAHTAACIEAARSTQEPGTSGNVFSDSYTKTLCSPAVETTAACISEARKALKTPAQIVPLCRPPNPT